MDQNFILHYQVNIDILFYVLALEPNMYIKYIITKVCIIVYHKLELFYHYTIID